MADYDFFMVYLRLSAEKQLKLAVICSEICFILLKRNWIFLALTFVTMSLLREGKEPKAGVNGPENGHGYL